MKNLVVLFAFSFFFGVSLSAQNSDFDAYKKSKEAEFENFKKGQQAEFEAFKKANQAEFDDFTKKKNLFAKTILFEGTDSCFFKNQKLIQKLSPKIFDKLLNIKCDNCMYADTVLFKYNSKTWQSDLIVIIHSEKTKLPIHFTITHVGTSFENLILVLEENFIEIKETMKRQESAAWSGDPNYEYIK